MGPMGVGKTTLACRLAERLERPLRDSDRDLHSLFGRSGRTIASEQGVDALHELEAAVLLGALADRVPVVVAAAGWVVEDPRCRTALARRALVVVLDLPPDRLVERLQAAAADEQHRRAMDRAEIEAVARHRRLLYEEVADLWIEADRPPDDLVVEVMAALGDPP